MPRKKEPTCITEKYTFPTRLRELMESYGTTQKKLADAIDMRPQTVSLYTTGQSFPDVNTLKKIAEFFNVSADYLLGLTDVKKPDATIQAICEYTGLSEHAVSVLHTVRLKEQGCSGHTLYQRFHKPLKYYCIDVLNYLLVNRNFLCVLDKFLDFGLYLNGSQNPSILPFEEMIEARDKLFEHGFVVLDPFHQQSYFRHNILSDFEHVLEQFTCAFQDLNVTLDDVLGNPVPLKLYSFDTDDEGGSDNGFNQEID